MTTKKVWIITGAISGIGLAVIEFLLRRGVVIIAVMDDTTAGERTAGIIHENLKVITLDSSDEDGVGQVVASIQKEYGRIDALINQEGLENSRYAMSVVGHVLPYMMEAHCGHIFFVSFFQQTSDTINNFIDDCGADLQAGGVSVTVLDPTAFQTSYKVPVSFSPQDN